MGSYVDYVDDLVELMEASVVEQLDGTQSTSSSLSTDQRSEIHTRVKEHQRSQQRIDKQVTKLDKEKSEILAYFFENPTDYAPAKATRLAELNTLLDDLEKDWLNDQEGIDQLRDELDG